MAPDLKKEIFRPFYTTRREGTGLGLSIARRLVELSGGTLALVNARALGGAAFEIALRLAGHSRARADQSQALVS